MTLTRLLDNPRSPISQFLDRHCDPAAVEKLLYAERWDQPVAPADALTECAFRYLLRWRFESYYPADTFGWIGAKLLEQTGEYTKLVWAGNLTIGRRIEIALLLAQYELYARTEQWVEIDDDGQITDDLVVMADRLPDSLTNNLFRYQHAPTFSASGWVGGAHADALVDTTLVEVESRVDEFTRGLFLRGILHLLLDFDNALGVQNLGFYFALSGRYRVFPTQRLVKDLRALRRAFQDEVEPLPAPRFDRHCVDTLAFQKHDFGEQ